MSESENRESESPKTREILQMRKRNFAHPWLQNENLFDENQDEIAQLNEVIVKLSSESFAPRVTHENGLTAVDKQGLRFWNCGSVNELCNKMTYKTEFFRKEMRLWEPH